MNGSRAGGEPPSANQPMPSRTRSIASVYGPEDGGAVNATCSVFEPPGAMSAPSGVRGPSQTMVAPVASKMWNDRFTGVAPLTLQVWFPVFVTVTDTVFDSSQYALIVAGIAYDAAKRAVSTTAAERKGALPKFVPNHPTPSRTRSTVSVY